MNRIPLIISLLISLNAFAQRYPVAVTEYRPAPGQHINADYWGSPSAAASLTGNSGHISLGAFGGSVTVQFSPAIQNNPMNEYGVDFVILGNPQTDWCEGGAVQVMYDANANGLPDDKWYQLASSQHFFSSARQSAYTYNNSFSAVFPVTWQNTEGQSGAVNNVTGKTNEFYPQQDSFPSIPADGAVYTGWEYQPKVRIATGSVKSLNPAFGIADNHPIDRYAPLNSPDNPYTPALEGCGGDSFDISWAVDEEGKYVLLDSVHFVRIYNAYQAMGGWLGELSPEITSIYALNPVKDPTPAGNRLVLDWLPDAVLAGTSLGVDAAFFKAGKYRSDYTYTATVSDMAVLSVDKGLQLTALSQGTVRVTVKCNESPQDSATVQIKVHEPSKIQISVAENIFVGDTVNLSAQITDIEGQTLDFLPVSFRTNASEARIWNDEIGRTYFTADREGTYTIITEANNAQITETHIVKVQKTDMSPQISLSFYEESAQQIAAQTFQFKSFDLTEYVSGTYSASPAISLASAIAFPFGNVSFESDLRFQQSAKGISLKTVPVFQSGLLRYLSASPTAQWAIIADSSCYINGLDRVSLTENMSITAVLTSGKTAFTNIAIANISKTELKVSVYQNEIVINGTDCKLTRTPIAGAEIQSLATKSVTGTDGSAVFARNSAEGQTFTYKDIAAANGILRTSTKEMYADEAHDPADWSQYSSIELFSIDGRKIFESSTSPLVYPVTRELPACYVIKAQLHNGKKIVEQLCN